MANRERPARPAKESGGASSAESGSSSRAARAAAAGARESLHFSTVNLGLGGAGLIALVLGYWLLAQGSITAAPLLLVLGYVVLLPLALIL
jgi:hypothetical protein